MIFLKAKLSVVGAAVTNVIDANILNTYPLSERALIDTSFSTIAGIDHPFGGYNGYSIRATAAQLNFPTEIAFDGVGHLYFIDKNNHRIRKVDKDTGNKTTMVGTGETTSN